VAAEIGRACREYGFFYVVGHGLDPKLGERLERVSREFFALDQERKRAIRMELGGSAWRGWFPVGGELTLGLADEKEGLYFGAELDLEHPRVKAGMPMHGPNLFPDVPGFRAAVLETLECFTELGHALMQGIALSLGLEASYFHDRYTADPLILFRIFHYPPLGASEADRWSVGEHTDYGLLTILRQDDVAGLQVKTSAGWIDAPPLPGSLVCNLGDMLDRMTGGLYRSTPHRVRNSSDRARLSFPFFFDPDFQVEVHSINTRAAVRDELDERWDGASVHEFSGTYGEYLLGKVSKVFPQLGRKTL
jgi:isopenicillin N synthase-like dioxygenase